MRRRINIFAAAIQKIKDKVQNVLDILNIAESMDKVTKNGADNFKSRNHFPPAYEGKADDRWHTPDYSDRPPAPPIGSIFEGRVISLKPRRELWYVLNGTLRGFPGMQTFIALGWDDVDWSYEYRYEKDPQTNIPEGELIPAIGDAGFDYFKSQYFAHRANLTYSLRGYELLKGYFRKKREKTIGNNRERERHLLRRKKYLNF